MMDRVIVRSTVLVCSIFVTVLCGIFVAAIAQSPAEAPAIPGYDSGPQGEITVRLIVKAKPGDVRLLIEDIEGAELPAFPSEAPEQRELDPDQGIAMKFGTPSSRVLWLNL